MLDHMVWRRAIRRQSETGSSQREVGVLWHGMHGQGGREPTGRSSDGRRLPPRRVGGALQASLLALRGSLLGPAAAAAAAALAALGLLVQLARLADQHVVWAVVGQRRQVALRAERHECCW